MTIVTKTDGDTLSALEVNTMDDALDAVIASNATKAPLNSPTLTGTPVAPTATPGTNSSQLATTAFVAAAVAAGGGGGGGGGSTAWTIATVANPASPYAPSGLSGNTVLKLTGLTGNKTLNLPTGSTFPAGRNWIIVQASATGGPWTITPGAGITHDGIGVAPTLTVPAGGIAEYIFYTDDAGASFKFSGDFDFAANKALLLAALGITTLKARFEILTPTAGPPAVLLRENFAIGTIISALCETDVGSATVNLQIGDKTGASNYTVTGAASITGLGALAVTTTPTRTAASGNNTMNRTGLTDRTLQAVLTSVTGSPNLLVIEVEYAL